MTVDSFTEISSYAYPFAMCLVDFTEILQFARRNALFAFSRKIYYSLAFALLWFVCQYVLSNIDNFALWLLNILPSCTCQNNYSSLEDYFLRNPFPWRNLQKPNTINLSWNSRLRWQFAVIEIPSIVNCRPMIK